MRSRGPSLRAAAPLLAAALGLPVLGAAAAGRDLAPLLRFPPRWAPPPGYVRFSWAFVLAA
ncbi:MAG TPA: hypothetical protein VHC86_04265, partial [Opitutaceae bacterium]|nr:hypothetical protein [Opitutaceae bacterium]